MAQQKSNLPCTTLTVKACVIRDGTPGISLSMGRELIGEWTDSKAKTLSLTDEGKVAIHGADGEQLYLSYLGSCYPVSRCPILR